MSRTNDPDNVSLRTQIDAILYSGRSVMPAIRMYLHEVDRFAAAHACPLLDEEVAFIAALYARYVGTRQIK